MCTPLKPCDHNTSILYPRHVQLKYTKDQPLHWERRWEAGVKIIVDGSPHCGTAAVREPFMNSNLTQTLGFPPAPCYGQLNYSTEEMLETVKFFHQQGTQIPVHAHGERAIDQVISVYEQVST